MNDRANQARKTPLLLLSALLFFAGIFSVGNAEAATGVCRVVNPGRTIEVPGSCGTAEIASRYFSACYGFFRATESIGAFNMDMGNIGATTGKRVWAGTAAHSFQFTCGGDTTCNSKNRGRRQEWCDQLAANANATGGDFLGYCPDPTKARPKDISGTSGDQCAKFLPANNCYPPSPPTKDGNCKKDIFTGEGDPSDADCPEFDEYAYNAAYYTCVNRQQEQHDACVKAYYSSDCYCTSPTDYYKFDTSRGAWFCFACPSGTVQDQSGAACRANCAQGQGLVDGKCETCDLTTNRIDKTGFCRPKCEANETEDPVTGDCTQSCPSGMYLNAAKTMCGCTPPGSSTWGSNPPRMPVTSGSLAGVPYPVWRSGGNVPVGSTSTGLSCACSDAPGSTHVSMIDQVDAISSANPVQIPYGRVGVVTGIVSGTNTFACGCPNYNETFQNVGGVWRCQPRLTGGGPGGTGITLREIPTGASLASVADRTRQGIMDALSEMPTQPLTMLRERGSSGKDVSVTYHRRVWACMDGFAPDSGNVCRPIESDPALLAQQNCSDTTPIPSSNFLPAATLKILSDSSKSFANLTNKRLACCLGQRAMATDPAKFQCAASQASAYASFDEYYDVGGGSIDWAGVSNPNRLFLQTADGRPIPGAYTKDGRRCDVFNGLTPTQQLAALSVAVANLRADPTRANPFAGIAGITPSAANQEQCRVFVRTALEIECGSETLDPVLGKATVSFAKTSGDYKSADNRVRRCFQPSALQVHYSVDDLTDVNKTGIAPKRALSSIGQNGEPAVQIDIQRLISGAK